MRGLSCMMDAMKRLRHQHRVEGVNARLREQAIDRRTADMTDEINADPHEVKRLLRSRRQVREGKVHQGIGV